MSGPNWQELQLATAEAAVRGDHLTFEQKELRKRFVKEMIDERNPMLAAIRCGYDQSFAVDAARQMLSEPYTLNLLRQEESAAISRDPAQLNDKDLAKWTLKRLIAEASYGGPDSDHKARVTALSKIAAILHMEEKQTDPNAMQHVIEVPAMSTNVDDWEAAAVKQQAKLKKQIRE